MRSTAMTSKRRFALQQNIRLHGKIFSLKKLRPIHGHGLYVSQSFLKFVLFYVVCDLCILFKKTRLPTWVQCGKTGAFYFKEKT
jgi:hypothetical protein